jgi:hypothetical protein
VIYLLLILGLGLSFLLTELSLGLTHRNAYIIGLGMFIGSCIAIVVGNYSHRNIFGLKPVISAFIFYWLIVAIGTGINMVSKE